METRALFGFYIYVAYMYHLIVKKICWMPLAQDLNYAIEYSKVLDVDNINNFGA